MALLGIATLATIAPVGAVSSTLRARSNDPRGGGRSVNPPSSSSQKSISAPNLNNRGPRTVSGLSHAAEPYVLLTDSTVLTLNRL